jgi:hypothetical protein
MPVVADAVRHVLAPYLAKGPVTGVSCLAVGADQLFAEIVLELGGELEVILPAPDYRSRQIEPDNAHQFDRLLTAAHSVRTTGFERSCRQAYLAAGAALLASVDLLVAVWDGRPATRTGSTGEVVDLARRRGLPVAVVWPPGAARDLEAPVPVRVAASA